MLHSIGRKPRTDDVVDLLLECHVRIRTFGALAVTIGERLDAPEDEVLDACARVERYFTEAFPLHVRDEEDSVLPRLRGRSAEIDAMLDRMHVEHDHHLAPLHLLLDALGAVRSEPANVPARATLLAAAHRVRDELEPHLVVEESVLFPAMRTMLSAPEQAEILGELRARRSG